MMFRPGQAVRLKLSHALTALVLLAVLSTAALVHFSWKRTAGRNVDAVVGALSAGTASTVHRELETTFAAAEAAVEIVRSILFQGAISANDEAKREYVFLPVLRSQPAVSWVGLGFADGRFFGAHELEDGKIEMVEIGSRIDETQRSLRRDLYAPLPGDIFFEARSTGASAYVPAGAKWFRAAKEKGAPVWTQVEILPSGFEPAAVASAPLVVQGRFEGVLMASLNFTRLTRFLQSLDIARDGAARIVNAQGTVLAESTTAESAGFEAAFLQSAQQAAGTDRMVDVPGQGAYYSTVSALGFEGWRLETVVPRQAFTAAIDRDTQSLLVTIVLLALLGAVSAALFAHAAFARPVARIVRELRNVENFALEAVRHHPSPLTELDQLSGAIKRMAASLAAFGLYVPKEIVRTLIAQGIDPKPGGELCEITVIFADLPGFTKLTERYGSGVAPFLTAFLTTATAAIHREGGTVDKFIGDCIMGIWNAPLAHDDHAAAACRAALAIREAMHAIARPDGVEDGPRVRIGINTGPALAGNIGSLERLSYTVIGDTVNVASRLEGLAKEFGCEIAAGEDVTLAAPGFLYRALGESAIRGRSGVIQAFELIETSDHPCGPARAASNSRRVEDARAGR